MKTYTAEIINILDGLNGELCDISKKIWDYAELPLEEVQSSQLLMDYLKDNGFTVEKDLCGMPTAFIASYGEGKPIIGLLGEYDSLPGLSQKPTTKKEAVEEGRAGHGCGHNLLGTAMSGSAIAIKKLMKEHEIKGTIRFYGCPAEEIMYGKIKMVECGLFDDLDIALTWHPMTNNTVSDYSYSAMTSIKFKFLGKTSHAAAAPEQGRSALDAVELMNVGSNYLREHIISQARMHYVITDGGDRPNIVPGTAESWYYVRAPYKEQINEILERLINVAKGAALMTDTKVCHEILSGCNNTIINNELNKLLYDCMLRIPRSKWAEEEIQFAKEILDTFDSSVIQNTLLEFSVPELKGKILHEEVTKLKPSIAFLSGSTDVSDVSKTIPTAQVFTCCMAVGVPGHTWQATSCSGMSIGQKGMLYAAKVIADAAMVLLSDKEIIDKAWEEFKFYS